MIYIRIITIVVIGTLLHFVYEWSHHNKAVAIFAAVNESTWEHIKIGMTPTLLWCIYDFIQYGFNGNILISETASLLVIIVLIPILFYTYSFFTKKSILVVDIICFIITIITSQLVFYILSNCINIPIVYLYISIVVLLLELIAYLTLSFKPFKNFIFKDPITHKNGLEGHPCEHHH